LIVHLSLPELRHFTMTNEQSTMNDEQYPDDYVSKISYPTAIIGPRSLILEDYE